MPRIVFVLVPRLHLLDLAGPAQVFSTAADLGHGWRLHYVAEHTEIHTAQGVPVRAELDWPSLGPADLVMVPGWRSPPLTDGPAVTEATAERLREHHRRGGTIASVCSGAYVLGQAGLLDGRRCTTHHALQDDLAKRFRRAEVVRDVLWVEDARVVTSAGIASGIDLALHLIAVRHGPAVAARVARQLVVFARRNGDAAQESVMLRHRSHLSDVVHRVQDLIDERYSQNLRLEDLAAYGGVSTRTLTRSFAEATGLTPLRYQQSLRTERATHLIASGSSVESAARQVGFADARMLRRLRSRLEAAKTA
ncbi:GlxA family transcriptional regulator [Stackebrandtia nassauensis]|uniref:Transcriptional regulator, AraC family n=1 Tax=Stackebrandtia nassauensis (strain DSM 44728 / CIP 108903 / NRRL B-16338 / NBRC 102104 / LLR-40K-21) TaxID=446470 RepID=D3Q3V1_STANL|nr:AraC family transcriptional regulator [Stackebrandtia nassauensis]ADD44018.1 transcriptional regulator, AraC family [Stackebrandtia nassauensis DSM 44728]